MMLVDDGIASYMNKLIHLFSLDGASCYITKFQHQRSSIVAAVDASLTWRHKEEFESSIKEGFFLSFSTVRLVRNKLMVLCLFRLDKRRRYAVSTHTRVRRNWTLLDIVIRFLPAFLSSRGWACMHAQHFNYVGDAHLSCAASSSLHGWIL